MDPSTLQEPASYPSDGYSPIHLLLEQALKDCDNPHLTYETLVLRLIKRQLALLHVPWTHVLETVRQGPCLLDRELHRCLQHMWNHRKRPVTLDEQHCIERVLGHDHNRVGDMMKLAGILNKIAEPVDLYQFYAMDGFLGDDPKRYVDTFRYGTDDVQYKHFQAVRETYQRREIETPSEMREMLESVFASTAEQNCVNGVQEGYVWSVGGWQIVKEIADWRREQEERMKKKRSAEEDKSSKVIKLEE